jgi:hypothetical protein
MPKVLFTILFILEGGVVNLNNLCWGGGSEMSCEMFTLRAVQINYSQNQWMNRIEISYRFS